MPQSYFFSFTVVDFRSEQRGDRFDRSVAQTVTASSNDGICNNGDAKTADQIVES